MRAVTFQAPYEVRVEEKPEPELLAPDDAIVRIEATGVCGSDLHIFHGRVQIEPGFTIGHEYVGTVEAAGDAVTSVSVGDQVLGCFQVACGTCYFCRAGNFHKCDGSRTFGHGAALGGLQGTQADKALVPKANLTLRRVPEGLSRDVALFAGDVMGTGYHATVAAGVRPGDVVAVLGLGPVGLCAVQAARVAGAAQVIAVDTVADRLEMARSFGAQPVHLTEEYPRAEVKRRPAAAAPTSSSRPSATRRRSSWRSAWRASAAPCQRRRRLRRALRGPHGPALDQGAPMAPATRT